MEMEAPFYGLLLRENDPDLTLFKTTGVVETIRKIINETTPETIIAKHHNTEPLAFRELKEAPSNNGNKSIIPAGKICLEGRTGPKITGIFGSMRPGRCDAIRFKRYVSYFCASIVQKIRSEEKCTKQYSLLSVFLQTDQMWRLMWSSGFHFCLFSSPVNDLPFLIVF